MVCSKYFLGGVWDMRCCCHEEGALGRQFNQTVSASYRQFNQQNRTPARQLKHRERMYCVLIFWVNIFKSQKRNIWVSLSENDSRQKSVNLHEITPE